MRSRNALLLAGAAISLASPVAKASFMLNDPVEIIGGVVGAPGSANWGAQAPPVAGSDNGLPHDFGKMSIYRDDLRGLPVIVESFEIPAQDLPEGKKFGGVIRIDFTDFLSADFWSPAPPPLGPGVEPSAETDFGDFFIHIENVKLEGELNSINKVGANQGDVFSDGKSIWWDTGIGLGVNLDPRYGGDPIVEITWTQIPAPATGLLLAGASVSLHSDDGRQIGWFDSRTGWATVPRVSAGSPA